MNYIWELLIRAEQDGLDTNKVFFSAYGSHTSPYLEVVMNITPEKKLDYEMISQVDVNPFIRFGAIFERFILTKPSDTEEEPAQPLLEICEYEQFHKTLTDVLLHYLGELDLKTGRRRRDFYVEFITADIEEGIFEGLDSVKLFLPKEKRTMAEGLLYLYATGDALACLIRVTGKLFPFCQVIIRGSNELVFYLREPKHAKTDKKLRFVIRLFLPVYIEFNIHWEKTYGIIGQDKTMKLGEFIL